MTELSPLERAARALAERAEGGPWVHLPQSHQQSYIDDAIAVVQAIREPIEEAVVFISSNAACAEYPDIQENLVKRLRGLIDALDTAGERTA